MRRRLLIGAVLAVAALTLAGPAAASPAAGEGTPKGKLAAYGYHLYGEYCLGLPRRATAPGRRDRAARRDRLRPGPPRRPAARDRAVAARGRRARRRLLPAHGLHAAAAPRRPAAARARQLLTDRQIRALVAYVASLGGGPAIPTPHPERGSLSEGQNLFTEHCAGCHQVVAQGGYVTGAVPPPLEDATATPDRRGGADRAVRDAEVLEEGYQRRAAELDHPLRRVHEDPRAPGRLAARLPRPGPGGARDLVPRGGRADRLLHRHREEAEAREPAAGTGSSRALARASAAAGAGRGRTRARIVPKQAAELGRRDRPSCSCSRSRPFGALGFILVYALDPPAADDAALGVTLGVALLFARRGADPRRPEARRDRGDRRGVPAARAPARAGARRRPWSRRAATGSPASACSSSACSAPAARSGSRSSRRPSRSGRCSGSASTSARRGSAGGGSSTTRASRTRRRTSSANDFYTAFPEGIRSDEGGARGADRPGPAAGAGAAAAGRPEGYDAAAGSSPTRRSAPTRAARSRCTARRSSSRTSRSRRSSARATTRPSTRPTAAASSSARRAGACRCCRSTVDSLGLPARRAATFDEPVGPSWWGVRIWKHHEP